MSATDVQLSEQVKPTPKSTFQRYQANCNWKLYEKEWIYRNFSPTGKSWLDFGCGTGEISTQLAKLGASHVIGVDITPGLIEHARLRAELDGVSDHVDLYCCDITVLEPQPVDVVLSYAVLHHLPDRLQEVIPALRRWIKPGGVFLCIEPVSYSPLLEWIRQRSGIRHDELDPGERKLTRADLDKISKYFSHTEHLHFRLFSRLSRLFPKIDRITRTMDSVALRMPGISMAAGTVIQICRVD